MIPVRWCGVVLLGALASFAPGQVDPDPPKPDVEKAKAALLEHLQKAGIRVDLVAGTLTLPAAVNRPADPLEYLLIHKRGKTHEALFKCEAMPSVLNSAFLLLGFEPGKNASFEPIEPPPSEAEIINGAEIAKVVPPSGMKMWMTVRWKDDAKVEHHVAVEDLLVDMTTGEPIEACTWIYLGGRMAALYRNEPPVYIADYEGNLVSICYLTPDNHLVAMGHERARDEQNWWMTKICPPPGTEVELTFHRNKPAQVVAREKRAKKDEPAPKKAGKEPR